MNKPLRSLSYSCMFRSSKSIAMVCLLAAASCNAQPIITGKFDLPVITSIRAIAVINDSTVWFAGSNGNYGYTENYGRHWYIDSVVMKELKPDFRSMSVTNDRTIFLLNAGSPARLLKSADHAVTWKTVYANKSTDIFFDSIKFWDEKNGIAVGDPIKECFTIIITHDGGETWQQVACEKLPKAVEGEACFAASNTCIDVFENNIWIATGGSQSRVLYSADNGNSWSASETPVMRGGAITGIFSIDFYDEKHGMIVGGNYDQKEINQGTKAVSSNGGKSWKLVADGHAPGFSSCVQYQPNSSAQNLLIAAHPGIFFSNDSGKHWQEVKDESGNSAEENYNTIQFSPSGKIAWCGGANGKIARVTFK